MSIRQFLHNTLICNYIWLSIGQYKKEFRLNGTYFQSLPEIFRNHISETILKNENNQWYGTNGGEDTADKIFLLSISEVVKYFGDSGQLKNGPKSDSSWINDKYNSERITKFNGVACCWWLRSPGVGSGYAGGVNDGGGIGVNGLGVNNNHGGVRPALWLNLES